MAVVQAHRGGARDVGQHGLLLVRQRRILLRVALAAARLLQGPAVGVGAVLRKPLLHLVNRLADEQLLECVHLLAPGTGTHNVGLAPVALRRPAGDLLGELLLRVRRRAVHHGVVVRVVVVAALAGPTAEVRHLRPVIVRRRVLKLVHVNRSYPALAVEQRVGKHLVYAVYRRAGVVGAGAHAHGVRKAEALVRLGSDLGLLSRPRGGLRLGLGAAAAREGVLYGVDYAVAGIGRAGDDVHVRRVRRDDGRRDLLKRAARYLDGLAVGDDLDGGDGVAVHGDGHGDGAYEAVGRAGERAAAAARAVKRVLDGVDYAVAGIGRAGDDVHIRRVSRNDGRRDLLKRSAGYLRRLAVGDYLHGGDLVAIHGDGDGDGTAEAVGRTGERAARRTGLLHVLARRVHAGDDGGGADGGARHGVDVAVDGQVALGVHKAHEEEEIVLHSEAEAVGVVDVAHGVALDDALVVHGDEELYLIHVAVRGHRQDVAALALIDVRDLGIGALVLYLLELTAAGQEVGDHLAELFLGVCRCCACEAGACRREYDGAGQYHGDGDK